MLQFAIHKFTDWPRCSDAFAIYYPDNRKLSREHAFLHGRRVHAYASPGIYVLEISRCLFNFTAFPTIVFDGLQ